MARLYNFPLIITKLIQQALLNRIPLFRYGVIIGKTVEQGGEIGLMTSSEFDKYNVDHLFLLVGENPLPNYVAARLLLNQGGTPYLVHTTHTHKQAKRLEKVLGDEGIQTTQLVSLDDYESDAYHIKEAICSKLEAIKDESIGLNYTGGTKAMAVHAYRAIFSQANSDPVFSYLDSRRLEMCIDQENAPRIQIKVKPEVLQIKLAKLFQIHDLNLKHNPTQEPQFPDLATALAEVFKDNDNAKQRFDDWYDIFQKEVHKNKKKLDLDGKSKTALSEISRTLSNLPEKILKALSQENLVTPENKLSLKKLQGENKSKKLNIFCNWLNGFWLEHYVLQQVKTIAEQNSIKDYGLNFEVWLPKPELDFEFDVAFTRGYQLFAISVSTTIHKSLCKMKLFEAYLRSRQMGGDEARVALICCTDKPDALKAEIDTFLNDNKIAVFGREDLIDLASKIEQWIQKNDKDAR